MDSLQELSFGMLSSISRKRDHLTGILAASFIRRANLYVAVLWLFLLGVDEMNSQVCICVEETTAGICKEHRHNPVIIAATNKRLINVIFCLGSGAPAFISCL